MKNIFNFYLDDDIKKSANDKLIRLLHEQSKGQLAALIRVLLKQFVMTPDDKVNPLLLESIYAEYCYSQVKNKRSRL